MEDSAPKQAGDKEPADAPTSQPASFDWDSCAAAFNDKHAAALERKRGYSKETIAYLRESKKIGVYRGRVAFPVIDGAHYKQKEGGWAYSKGSKVAPLSLGKIEEGAQVHIFESPWDAITYASSSGETDNIVATLGAENVLTLRQVIDEHFSGTLYLWPQHDQPKPPLGKMPGYIWANKIAALFPDVQKKVVMTDTAYKDLNEWVVEGHATEGDVFNAYLSAKPYTELVETSSKVLDAANPTEIPTTVTDLKSCLDGIEVWLEKYIKFPEPYEAGICALWAVHTWVYDVFYFTPYLHIHSPEPQSGKTTLLKLLYRLSANPWIPIITSEAAMYNKIDQKKPSCFIDEVDAIYGADAAGNEPLRAVLNAGYERGEARVPRMIRNTLKEYDVFCPKAFGGLGGIPPTIASRSINIPMARQDPDDMASVAETEDLKVEAAPFVAFLKSWADQSRQAFSRTRPTMPQELDGRQRDISRPLISIADAAGPEWGDKARNMLVAAFNTNIESTDGVKLLSSIKSVFDTKDKERLTSHELLESLVAIEDAEAPWANWWERKLRLNETQGPSQQLAKMLAPYGIKPRTLRFPGTDNKPQKGYERVDFYHAWKRYVKSEKKQVNMELDLQ